MDKDNDANCMDIENENDLKLDTKRGIHAFELNEECINGMMKEKQDEILKIIPHVFDASNDNKITLIHPLRLFAKDCTEDSKKGIIEETYSEIEFIEPYYYLYSLLMMGPHKFRREKHPFSEHWKHRVLNIAQKEQALIQTISNTHNELLKKIEAAQDEYQRLLSVTK